MVNMKKARKQIRKMRGVADAKLARRSIKDKMRMVGDNGFIGYPLTEWMDKPAVEIAGGKFALTKNKEVVEDLNYPHWCHFFLTKDEGVLCRVVEIEVETEDVNVVKLLCLFGKPETFMEEEVVKKIEVDVIFKEISENIYVGDSGYNMIRRDCEKIFKKQGGR